MVDIEDVFLQPGGYTIGARLQSEQNKAAYFLCRQFGIGCDTVPDEPPESIEDQFFWNFDVGLDGDADPGLIPNDPRVEVDISAPYINGERRVSNVYADFSLPSNRYFVGGAFVGPNFFLAPVPEPTTGVLAVIAILFVARLPRE